MRAADWQSEDGRIQLFLGDCLEILPTISAGTVDAVVTDPPYGLGFMGKEWDHSVPSSLVWKEVLRVLKPGGHLLCFAGTRTQHRMACNIEDAGFEIRDMIAWVYGSGFPKSHNLRGDWSGWGTALKPALEPITVARKPLEGTVAANVQKWGTGAINVDGCRVGTETIIQRLATVEGGKAIGAKAVGVKQKATGEITTTIGRWPANLIHDGSEEVLGVFPQEARSAGLYPSESHGTGNGTTYCGKKPQGALYEDSGSAARFFYCAKASRADRNAGLERFPWSDSSIGDRRPSGSMSQRINRDEGRPDTLARNHHPTVKPTDLMRYLCRLVTPTGGIVLDPFMGSGSTGRGAVLEGFRFIGIEIEPKYFNIAVQRIKAALAQPDMFVAAGAT